MKLAVNGTELFFDVDGAALAPAGPWMRERLTVVFLPTSPGIDHPYKGHIGPALAEVAQVIYLDTRGSGRSDWGAPEEWTLDTWVADLEAFCDALELERPALLGTAVGGLIALQYAARHPDRVERLVLASVAARHVHTRSIAVFDRIGGPEAGEVAARYFADPTEANFGEFMRVCVPLYPDAGDGGRGGAGRAERRPDCPLGAHDARHHDVRPDAARVTCRPCCSPATTIRRRRSPARTSSRRHLRPESFATSATETGHGIFADRPEAIGPS